MTTLENKIRGVLFGNAIGDAIGLGTEFMSKFLIKAFYTTGLRNYSDIHQDAHRIRWKKGEWTDDTDQMLCILDSLVENKRLDYKDVAKRIHQWAYSGGRGIGNTVFNALKHPQFLQNPHAVAEEIWVQGNKQVAANGAIMRTSVLGIWQYQDLSAVRQNTENVAKITHFDPRCIGSCVALTTTIARILQGETDINKLYDCAEAEALPYDVRILPYLQDARKQPITHFDLEEKTSIGYTLKALACAFWALQQDNFQDAISAIIHEGGDADTNGAVAGALLGAKLGYDSLPTNWLYGLLKRSELEQKADKLCALL